MQGAYVTLVPTPKSHHFEERRIKVGSDSEPVKIGRAVARIQPTNENAVFDCKVLSRNHAVLWYKDGEFFLRDTKSSNGTFVNNEKLQSTKDADFKRVYSGDIIQFGVEIVENTNKVAYGCIYAVIQCYNHEGKLVEMISSGLDDSIRSNGTLVSNRKLFQMQQYVSEAAYREKIRDEKIGELMSIIEANEQAAETAWKALVNEDRLLARIEALEAQLSVYSNNNHPDKQQEEMLTMIDEKTKFEAMTKEVIRRLQEEVGETASRLKDMERSLDTTETTCQQLRSANADLENILAETTQMYDQKVQEADVIMSSAQETQKALITCEEKLEIAQDKYFKLMVEKPEMNQQEALVKVIEYIENGTENSEKLADLIDVLKRKGYMTNDLNGYVSDDESKKSSSTSEMSAVEKSVESYLKDILVLQARNRDLEQEMSRIKEGGNHYVEKVVEKNEKLEISPTKNASFEPFIEGVGKRKMSDWLAQMSFLVSLVPFFALILTILMPIHNKVFGKMENEVENNTKKVK